MRDDRYQPLTAVRPARSQHPRTRTDVHTTHTQTCTHTRARQRRDEVDYHAAYVLLLETEAVELANKRVENAVAAAVGPAGASGASGIPAHDNDLRASSGAHAVSTAMVPVEPVEVLINFKLAFFK
jgi:hypothetical protein